MVFLLLARSWIFNDKHWAITTTGTAGGAETVAQLLSPFVINATKPYAEELVIDGVAVAVTHAAGHTIRPVLRMAGNGNDPYLAFPLDSFVVAAGVRGSRHYPDLCVQGPLWNQDLLDIYATYALNDTVEATLWGHYVPLAAAMAPQEPAPVSVQEFHLFRQKKVSGPV